MTYRFWWTTSPKIIDDNRRLRPSVPTPADEKAKYQRELKSEERRALIWLGLLAVIVAFYFWLRDGDPQAKPFYNFFCNSPCPHVTLYWIPFLELLIYYWLAYAGCMLIYFSEDLFHTWGPRGIRFREAFRSIGHVCLSVYPASFLILTFMGAFSLFLPNWLQTPYWVVVVYSLAMFGVLVFEGVTGRKDILRNVIKLDVGVAHDIAELLKEGLLPELEKIARRLLKGRIPPRLRRLWLWGKHLL